MSEKAIIDYEVKLETPGCHPDAGWYRVHVTFQEDITEVLPYLNAVLGGKTDYRHKDGILLWQDEAGKKNYAFRPNEIAITPANTKAEGYELANKIVARVNEIWNRRDEITPDIKGKAPLPNAMDIFKLLPRTNCKECGFPTCMAFAVALRSDSSIAASCSYLSENELRTFLP